MGNSLRRLAREGSAMGQEGFAGKRAFDLAAAAVGLVLLSPLVAACAILIRLSSQGPAIFRQTRIGKDERPFTCYKLRTMALATAHVPTHEMRAAAVTSIGRHLRRLKLDELPQLWNVLKGEMSFVGPRPCLPTQLELIGARRRRGLAGLLPGITGISQVAGIDMSDPERLAESDARYIKNMSLRTDLSLIWQAVAGAGRGDRVRA
jgi:O-antigen biosynthesis protein WbqP